MFNIPTFMLQEHSKSSFNNIESLSQSYVTYTLMPYIRRMESEMNRKLFKKNMNWLYDSHIHLSDPEYHSYIPYIINAMKLLKLKACCVSMDYDTSISTLNLSKKSDNILPFIGIHPEMSQKNTSWAPNPQISEQIKVIDHESTDL